MNRIKKFSELIKLNELFSFENEVKKQKIQDWILAKSNEFIDDRLLKNIGSNTNSDMKKSENMDRFRFWVAKQYKTVVLATIQKELDKLFKDGFRPGSPRPEGQEYGVKNDYKWNVYELLSRAMAWVKGKSDTELEHMFPPEHFSYYNNLSEDSKLLGHYLIGPIHTLEMKTSEWTNIVDYIFSSVRNVQQYRIDFVSADFNKMLQDATRWHHELKASGVVTAEEGTVIMNFKDNFYWIDLETSDCKEEASAMGHCGRTSADTILSLRERKKTGSEPHVTIAINYIDSDDPNEGYTDISQCKGKNNKKPVEKYHKYIVDLILKYNINSVDGHEYNQEDDFHISDLTDPVLIEKVLDHNPNLYIDTYGVIDNDAMKIVKPFLKDRNLWHKFIDSRGKISDYYDMWVDGEISNEDIVKVIPDLILFEGDNGIEWRFPVKCENLTDLGFLYSDGGRNSFSSNEIINHFFSEDSLNDFHLDVDKSNREEVIDAATDEQVISLIEKIESDLDVGKGGLTVELINQNIDDEDKHLERESDNEDIYESLKNKDLLFDVIEALDGDAKDEIARLYRFAYQAATEAQIWKDCTEGLEEYGISRDTMFNKYYQDGYVLLLFHPSMARQIENTYGLEGSKSESYLYKKGRYGNSKGPLCDMIQCLFDWEDINVDEDEATWTPIEIDEPYYGWGESPSAQDIRDNWDI